MPTGDIRHTFVVSAYGASPFLEQCVDSLVKQTCKSNIIIATATPNELIEGVASRFDVPLCIRQGEPGIADDWNYSLSCVQTPFATIAHQDDVYDSRYSKCAVEALSDSPNPLIYFSDYAEMRDGEPVAPSFLLRVKKKLLLPCRLRPLQSVRAVKRAPLAFGNPICCPSVTFALAGLPSPVFEVGFRSNLDWDAWERFSRLDGAFVYDPHVRMYHRVHGGSETSACIADNVRTKEDLAMLERFWPRPIAKAINGVYSKAQGFN